jgi:hypothetical protein
MIKLPVINLLERGVCPTGDASLRKSAGSAASRPAKERKEQTKRENVFERWTTLRDREEGMTRNRQQIFPLRVPFATLGRRILRDKLYRRYVEHATRGQRRAVRMEGGGEVPPRRPELPSAPAAPRWIRSRWTRLAEHASNFCRA